MAVRMGVGDLGTGARVDTGRGGGGWNKSTRAQAQGKEEESCARGLGVGDLGTCTRADTREGCSLSDHRPNPWQLLEAILGVEDQQICTRSSPAGHRRKGRKKRGVLWDKALEVWAQA